MFTGLTRLRFRVRGSIRLRFLRRCPTRIDGSLCRQNVLLYLLKESFVERTTGYRFAGGLDQRVVAGAQGHGYRAEHAQAYAGRVAGPLHRIEFTHSIGVDNGLVRATRCAGHVEQNLSVLVVVLAVLVVLVPTDLIRLGFVDDVALAQQGTPSRLASGLARARETMGVSISVCKRIALVDSGFVGTGCQ